MSSLLSFILTIPIDARTKQNCSLGLRRITDIFRKHMVKVESRGEKIALRLISSFRLARSTIHFSIDRKRGGVRTTSGDIGSNDRLDPYIYRLRFRPPPEYDSHLTTPLLFGFSLGRKLIKLHQSVVPLCYLREFVKSKNLKTKNLKNLRIFGDSCYSTNNARNFKKMWLTMPCKLFAFQTPEPKTEKDPSRITWH